MEEVRPVLIVGLDPAGKGLYPILPVQLGQMLQEVVRRIIERDVIGVDIAHDILVPALDALRQGAVCDGVPRLSGQERQR